MIKLHLVRHAQAENSGQYKDFFRPLTSKGMTDAARIAYSLNKSGITPNYLLASSAERAIRTAETFADQLKFNSEQIVQNQILYDGRMQEYLEIINTIPAYVTEAMVFGHNPIISYMAEYLTKDEIGEVPTAGVVSISFDQLSWAEVAKGMGKLTGYISPNHMSAF